MKESESREAGEDLKFEKAMEKLEKIVEYLEGDEISLDEALKKYEEGVKLARLCGEKLAQAEKKIEILTRGLSGSLKARPFESENAGRKGIKSAKKGGQEEESRDFLI